MRMDVLLATLATVAAALVSTDSLACGESMFRVGKGVHYRAYSAPIPGTVLVYARTDEERDVAEQLRQAGHEVLVVEDDFNLAMQLDRTEFDVIVAPASKREAVASSASGLASPPDWLPVFDAGTSDPQAIRADYGRGVSSDDDIRKYLKAIHKSLKNQDR
jgi:hypothetical protein